MLFIDTHIEIAELSPALATMCTAHADDDAVDYCKRMQWYRPQGNIERSQPKPY